MAKKVASDLIPSPEMVKNRLHFAVAKINERNGGFVLSVFASLAMHGLGKHLRTPTRGFYAVDSLNVSVEILAYAAGITLEEFIRERISGSTGDSIGGYVLHGAAVNHQHAAYFDERITIDGLPVLTIPACLRQLEREVNSPGILGEHRRALMAIIDNVRQEAM